MKNLFTVFLALTLTQFSMAETTRLTGFVKGHSGQMVRLVKYADQISYQKVTLDNDMLDEAGGFSLEAETDQTIYAMIEFNFQSGPIFLEPGAYYHLTLYPEQGTDKMAYYDLPPLNYTIENEPEQGINRLTGWINVIYNNFLLDNPRLFQSPGRKALVDEVGQAMRSRVNTSDNPYLQEYLRYKIASLELSFRTQSREKLAQAYLTGNEVLYENVEYMDFFHLFFEKYLLTNNLYLPYSKTSSLINEGAGLESIIAEFRRDPILNDARLAEMVLMSGLKEMSTSPGFKRERILDLLEEITDRSRFEEHRKIAGNLRERLLWMHPGTPAPGFRLEDVLGGMHELSQYQGQYVYLSFISLYSPSSMAEMNLLADIYEDYRHHLQFISIIVDELKPGWSDIISNYRMKWDLLLVNDDADIIEEYGATSLPLFLLIDEKGNISKYPAPSPSEDLRRVLDSI